MPLAIPNQNVLSVADTPVLQYCLKNTGKNTTMTVVANAEFAQSYAAQATTCFENSGDFWVVIKRRAAKKRRKDPFREWRAKVTYS
jgi:hypothetical protein